jgi:hypothetical protein
MDVHHKYPGQNQGIMERKYATERINDGNGVNNMLAVIYYNANTYLLLPSLY